MSEEKKPYLIINEEYDEIKINIKHTKPYMKLQQENADLKEKVILLRASEPMLELEKYYGDRDKYKEVIEEINNIIKMKKRTLGHDTNDSYLRSIEEILDKVKDVK